MLWVWISLGIVATLILLPVLVGIVTSPVHVVARRWNSSHPPEMLWQVITDYPSVPTWHAQVKSVERLPDHNGHQVWREFHRPNVPLQFESTVSDPPWRLTRTILDEKKVFFGSWEFELTPTPTGTTLVITEHGEIPNPFFRGIFRLSMNPALSIEKYLRALATRMGDPALITPVAPIPSTRATVS